MNRNTNLWTALTATAGIATLALTFTGCDTARNKDGNPPSDTRTTTDKKESSVDGNTTNPQQPGIAPSPSALDNGGNTETGSDTSSSGR